MLSRKPDLKCLFDDQISPDVIRLDRRMRKKLGVEVGECVHVLIGRGRSPTQTSLVLEVRPYPKDRLKDASVKDRLALVSPHVLVSSFQEGKIHTDAVSVYDGDCPEFTRVRRARPAVSGQASSLLGEIGSLWVKEWDMPLTVGADPEFGLINSHGRYVRADNVFHGGKYGQIGYDGPNAEIRPRPSPRPTQLVRNIYRLFRRAENGPVGPYRWIGGATYRDQRYYWLGGHLHFGRPSLMSRRCFGLLVPDLTRYLDFYLALPLTALDHPNPSHRRSRCPHRYGIAGSYRVSNKTAEYRVLSSLWLCHPVLSETVIALAKAISEAWIRETPKFIRNRKKASAKEGEKGRKGCSIDPYIDHGEALQRAVVRRINTANTSPLPPKLFKLWSEKVKELPTYESVQDEVELLTYLVKQGPGWFVPRFSLDIRQNWLGGRGLVSRSGAKANRLISRVESKM